MQCEQLELLLGSAVLNEVMILLGGGVGGMGNIGLMSKCMHKKSQPRFSSFKESIDSAFCMSFGYMRSLLFSSSHLLKSRLPFKPAIDLPQRCVAIFCINRLA